MIVGVGFTLSARHREGSVRPAPLDRRGHRTDLPAAVVLVANQRLERGQRDVFLVCDRAGVFRRWKSWAPVAATTVLLTTVAVTTAVWLVVTFVTPPVARARPWPLSTRKCAPPGRVGPGCDAAPACPLARFAGRRRSWAGCSPLPPSTERCSRRGVSLRAAFTGINLVNCDFSGGNSACFERASPQIAQDECRSLWTTQSRRRTFD